MLEIKGLLRGMPQPTQNSATGAHSTHTQRIAQLTPNVNSSTDTHLPYVDPANILNSGTNTTSTNDTLGFQTIQVCQN